jgi:hypothetical protein
MVVMEEVPMLLKSAGSGKEMIVPPTYERPEKILYNCRFIVTLGFSLKIKRHWKKYFCYLLK